MFGAIGSALSSVGGALGDAFSATNSFLGSNTGSAAMSLLGKGLDMWFNHNENEQNRDLTEKLFKNKYQYTVADLKAAGLNPALAYSGLSGSSPSMSAGLGSSGGLTSAKMLQKKEMDLLDRQIKTAEASAESASAKALSDRIDADLKKDFWVNMGPNSRRMFYGQQMMGGSTAGQISGLLGQIAGAAEKGAEDLDKNLSKFTNGERTETIMFNGVPLKLHFPSGSRDKN